MKAGEEEAILVANFDMQMIRRYQQRRFWGDTYRKPDQYKMLLFH
jgi:hypothetical protein